MTSDPGMMPVDMFAALSAAGTTGGIAHINGGGECCIVGGHFNFGSSHVNLLLEVLPPVVHLRKELDRASLLWSLQRMRQELCEPQPGSTLVIEHLAHMILLQALRLYVTAGTQTRVGWIFALADKQIGVAITAMHESPGHNWTLQKLGARVGMSRSVFAQKFKALVGTSAMEYLTRWRMMLAGERLTQSADPIAAVAITLGYDSESAFSLAFKRVMGCSPRQYSRTNGFAPTAARVTAKTDSRMSPAR